MNTMDKKIEKAKQKANSLGIGVCMDSYFKRVLNELSSLEESKREAYFKKSYKWALDEINMFESLRKLKKMTKVPDFSFYVIETPMEVDASYIAFID